MLLYKLTGFHGMAKNSSSLPPDGSVIPFMRATRIKWAYETLDKYYSLSYPLKFDISFKY